MLYNLSSFVALRSLKLINKLVFKFFYQRGPLSYLTLTIWGISDL